MNAVQVKQEVIEHLKATEPSRRREPSTPTPVIDLSSSSDSDSDDSSSYSSDDDGSGVPGTDGKRSRFSSDRGLFTKTKKRKKMEELSVALPLGFLDPLPPKNTPSPLPLPLRQPQTSALKSKSAPVVNGNANTVEILESTKQFWKAGDYMDANGGDWDTSSGGMDHVRVHPKFLHSNATSHKWVLGAFAELLDNSLDEVCYGATFVNIDMVQNEKDGSRMLLIEDNGGGMDPDKLRQCMSLGYSVKSKVADTIGQYGNGFKTSTMRLGADVIVFSRCGGQDGKRPTQSIGLLSYTFLRSTGKEDIVVPMLDYEGGGHEWNRMRRSSVSDWNRNVETILQWSPFSTEADLLRQFSQMKDHGTRIIIYNLWEDDQGQLELDFDADPYDIQIRGVNRDEKKILMAKQFPNSKHFLTYRHSFRSYASILYLRIPPRFRIILRGKDVVHHNIVNDMMMTQEIVYRPQHGTDGVPKDSHMLAVVTIGFVKDAKAHIDVQGFNVYHKNRLIKPFWRIWNSAGSDGRGVIGVLEADFVEPAHDKQGFERTTVLARLETKLLQIQKTYWRANAHKIGYAPRCDMKHRENSPDYLPQTPSQSFKKDAGSSIKIPVSVSEKLRSHMNQKQGGRFSEKNLKTADKSHANGHAYTEGGNGTKTNYPKKKNGTKTPAKHGKGPRSLEPSSPFEEDVSDNEMHYSPERRAKGVSQKEVDVHGSEFSPSNSNSHALDLLKEENRQLTERLKRREEEILVDLLRELQNEKERCKSLETKLEEATRKIEEMNQEQENLIEIFSEERERRDVEEENLRNKLKEASNTIKELIDKVRLLEKMKKAPSSKFDDYVTVENNF